MPPRLHLDFETRSFAPFGKDDKRSVGLDIYASHPTTSVWCFAYKFSGGPVQSWWRDEPIPLDVVEHVRNGHTVVAHNARFERKIWNNALYRMMNGYLPLLDIEQMDCTMARCQALSLPADLERAARVVNAPHQKDMVGSKSMLKMAKVKSVTWFEPCFADAYAAKQLRLGVLDDKLEYSTYGFADMPSHGAVLRLEWEYSAELRAEQDSYCRSDVLAEDGVDQVVSPLSPKELALWQWNERINDRGIPIDVPLIQKIKATAEAGKHDANIQIATLTGGVMDKVTQHGRLKTWLEERGIPAPDGVGKHQTDDLSAVALVKRDDDAVKAIQLHAATSKSSLSKLDKALDMKGPQDCIRGVFSYHAAGTGRFAAYGYQAHNLVRLDEESELPTVRDVIKILDRFEPLTAYQFIEMVHGRAMHWLSKCSRPTIRAPQGKIFRGADLSNIEGRSNAWVAGEQWKLDAFKAYDEKRGPDLYRVTAGALLNIDPNIVAGTQRQTFGKVPELASGFQGSVGAYKKMGTTTGVRPDQIADVAAQNTPPEVWEQVAKGYRPQYSSGLEKAVWTGVKIVVNAWRQRHPMIVQSWWDRQDAVLEAVSNPGQMVSVCEGRVRYLCNHGFLWTMLASGRLQAYPQPSIVRVTEIKEKVIGIVEGIEIYEEYEVTKNAVQVWGIDGGTKQWAPYTLYGGILCENDIQGLSRDICFAGAQLQTAFGYDICFHCHDETLAVCDPGFGSGAQIESLLTVQPDFDPLGRFPLAAKAWEDERYVK